MTEVNPAPPGVFRLVIEVPAALAEQTVAALRVTHSTVVNDRMNDAQAMRAVIAWWTANMLATHETEKVRKIKQQNVDKARADMEEASAKASRDAWWAVQEAMLAEPVVDEPVSERPGVAKRS